MNPESLQPLRFAHRADPEDAYLLGALAAGRVDAEGLVFEHRFISPSISEASGEPPDAEVAVLTLPALASHSGEWIALPSATAAALAGPWLAASQPMLLEAAAGAHVAVRPGHAAETLLARLLLPDSTHCEISPFGGVGFAVLPPGDFSVWREDGWHIVDDLGLRWRSTHGTPWPLWTVAARRSLGPDRIRRIERALGRSVQYARERPGECFNYARRFAPLADEAALAAQLAAQAAAAASIGDARAMLNAAAAWAVGRDLIAKIADGF